MDNIQVDNTCPTIQLWEQYKENETVVAFFSFLKTYYQTNYFNYLTSTAIPALSIINAVSAYLEYYALNLLNIFRPVEIIAGSKWDVGQQWDKGNLWDFTSSTGPISIEQFVTLLLWIFDWGEDNWTIPSMYRRISKFCDIGQDEIGIEQDDTNYDLIHIILPNNDQTNFFWSMVTYYPEVMRLPYGMYFDITYS